MDSTSDSLLSDPVSEPRSSGTDDNMDIDYMDELLRFSSEENTPQFDERRIVQRNAASLRNKLSGTIDYETIEKKFVHSRLPHHVFVRINDPKSCFNIKTLLLKMSRDELVLELQVAEFPKSRILFSPRAQVCEESKLEWPNSVLACQLRKEFNSYPNNMKIDRIIIKNSIGELEEVLSEVVFFKRWTAGSIDYIISSRMDGCTSISRLIKGLKVSDVTLNLQFGEVYKEEDENLCDNGHAHVLMREFDPKVLFPREDLNVDEKKAIYKQAAGAMWKARSILRTLDILRQLVNVIISSKQRPHNAQRIRKLRIKTWSKAGPCLGRCHNREELHRFKKELIVCLDARAQQEKAYGGCATPLSSLQLQLNSEYLKKFLIGCRTFKCAFDTNVKPSFVYDLLQTWSHSTLCLDELKLKIDGVLDVGILLKFEWIEKSEWWRMRRTNSTQTHEILSIYNPVNTSRIQIRVRVRE